MCACCRCSARSPPLLPRRFSSRSPLRIRGPRAKTTTIPPCLPRLPWRSAARWVASAVPTQLLLPPPWSSMRRRCLDRRAGLLACAFSSSSYPSAAAVASALVALLASSSPSSSSSGYLCDLVSSCSRRAGAGGIGSPPPRGPRLLFATAFAASSRVRRSSASATALPMSPPDEEARAVAAAAAAGAAAVLPEEPSSASLKKEQEGDERQDGPASPRASAMAPVFASLRNTWIEQLSPESPESYRRSLVRASLPETLGEDEANRTRRPVFNGHYVRVRPAGIANPRLVLYSADVASGLLRLTDEQVRSEDFLSWVSGNHQDLPPGVDVESWATPYALSIMGSRYTSNCPYGTGDGYGDGRALSIGQLEGHELQLKGAGTTPFCRGADGRAVLRSSVREFLASEAMHHLGIATTRALSLVVSETETVNRPWYSGAPDGFSFLGEGGGADSGSPSPRQRRLPSMDDPRLAQYPPEDRKKILAQLRQQKDDPNVLVSEPAAIACRVSPSFVRVGHLDLFARRAERASLQSSSKTGARWDRSTPEWRELEQMVWHACFREFKAEAHDPYISQQDVASAASALLNLSAERMAAMVAGWIRVGFAQGNFNGDNCLVAGRTMDYGPFGFMDEYHPLFAKWTGSGNHFGFLNQPQAGFANYQVLAESVVPVICAARGVEDPADILRSFLEPAARLFQGAVDQALRTKLGFHPDQDVGDDLWEALEPLLRVSRVDWTLFFRQLSYLAREMDRSASISTTAGGADDDGWTGSKMLEALEGEGGSDPKANVRNPFYEMLDDEARVKLGAWLEKWRAALQGSGALPGAGGRMLRTNPKYVPREWMLVGAYAPAQRNPGDESELRALHELFQDPYGEGTDREASRYYRRAPDEALEAGGTAFMS